MELSKLNSGPLAIALIKHFESLHDGDEKEIGLQPKMCPAGIWTEGYGHAIIDPVERGFLKGIKNKDRAYELSTIKTPEQADLALMSDLNLTYEPLVEKLITRKDLNANQFGALVSFAYNCGTHYKGSDGKSIPFAIWANVNNGMDNHELELYWSSSVIKAAGKVQPGLVRRRKAEAYLFINGVNKFYF